MRNLKRALSLTLASVMLLGMMVVGTSAASFPDVTEKDNVEAIEVLAAVKVLQGRDDGSFDPTATVTRNEMATIICRMMGWRDGDFAGLNPFPDVPDWAANYVAACVANGIINGRDDGRFHGDDTVTATEAASMMLRALGYTRMPVGAAWAQAVAQQASKINLFDGLDVGAYTAMNRGDVAQLALNTLESPMVEVEDNTLDINAGNGVSISGGQINYVVIASNKDYAKAISRVETEGHGLNGVSGPIVELGEQVFNGDLKKVNDSDNFGRPSAIWSYKSTEIGKYPDGAEQTWTGKVSEKALYDAVGTAAYNNYHWTVYQNGAVRVEDSRNGSEARDEAIKNSKTSSERVLSSGNGVVTQVYVDSDNQTVVLTMIDTGLAEVTRCTEVDGKYETTVSFKTKVADPNAGGTSRAYTPNVKYVSDQKFERGDLVIYTASVDSGSIESMAVAQTVTGTVTTVKNADYVIMDGKTYNYNFAYTKAVSAYGVSAAGLYSLDDSAFTNPAVDKEATLYLDAAGYPIAFEGKAATAEDYLYVKEVGEVFKSEPSAKVVFFDGTSATVSITKVDGKDATAKNGGTYKATDIVENAVYKYSKGTNGYSLEPVTQYYNNTADSVTITKNTPSITVDREWAGTAASNADARDGAGTAGYKIVTDNNTVFVDAKNGNAVTGYRAISTKTSANVVAVKDTNNRASIVFYYGDNLSTTPGNDDFIILKGTGVARTTVNGTTVYRYTDAWDANGNKLDNAYAISAAVDISNGDSAGSDSVTKGGKGVYLITGRDGDNNISDMTSNLFELTSNAGVKADGTPAATNYAISTDRGVIEMNTNIDLTPSGSATDRSVFGYNDDTKFLVVNLKKNGDPDGDITLQDASWIKAWDVNNKSECTGVYVLTVDDVTDTEPVAESVLIVVPDDTTYVGGSGGNGSLDTDSVDVYAVKTRTGAITVHSTKNLSSSEIKAAVKACLENEGESVDTVNYPVDGNKASVISTDGSTGTYTITLNRGTQAQVTGAKVMNEVQKIIENASDPADLPDSRATVTISGNTMTVTTDTSASIGVNDPRDYFTATSNNMSMHDLARFLGKLKTEAGATTITYATKTYTWDASKGGDSKSHWYNATDDQTLVAAIVATNKPLIQAWAQDTTASDGQGQDDVDLDLTISLTVDGAAMTIQMTIPKSGS